MFGQAFNSGFFKLPCFTDTTDIFKDRSGVALYTLDYDASDSGGATGKYKEGAVFNGSNAQIDTTATLIPSSTDFSISFWIKPENQFGTILARGMVTSGANAWGVNLAFNNSANKLRFFRHTGGAYANEHYAETATNSITVGVWQHVVLSFDKSAGAPQFYIDGSAVTTNIVTYAGGTGSSMATGNISFNSSYDGGRYRLGNRSNGGLSTSRFKGTLDHFRVFNKVVSASEVATLYSDATDTVQILGDTSCTAFYNFNNNALDLAGSHNPNSVSNIIYKYDGTPTNVDFGIGGKSNYGARFNGSNSKIDISSLSLFDRSSFTVSCWAKSTNVTTTGRIIGHEDNGGSAIIIRGDDVIIDARDNGASASMTLNMSTTNNQWHHICLVNDSNHYYLYLDGVEVDDNNYGYNPTSATAATGHQFAFGYRKINNDSYWSGDLDQVRVFSEAISASEVSKLYGNGAGEIACKYTATTTNANYPVTNLAYYKLDNSAVDETGNYSGTETNIEYRFGRYGQAAVFNGSSSKIETGYNANGSSNFTFSWWMHLTNTGNRNAIISDHRNTSADDFTLFIEKEADNDLNVAIGNNNNSYSQSQVDITNYLNKWSHFAVTISGTLVTVYADGSEIHSFTSSVSYGSTNTENYYLGTLGARGILWFDGQIDQVRIFSTALTSSQVTQLYNEKPETDTSNFKTVLYEANASTNFISNVGFQPDLVWTKSRDNAYNHLLYDSIRGAGNYLQTNTTIAQAPFNANTLSSFESTGFILGNVDNSNYLSGTSSVAWCWKAGGDAVTGTGTGVTNVSISANTDAGFSIVKYTGSGAAGMNFGHGLTEEIPELVIIKNLSIDRDWQVFGGSIFERMQLNNTGSDDQNLGLTITSTTIQTTQTSGFEANSGWNALNNDYIAYIWHSVSGYSKIGTYEGLGTSTVTVSDVGFKPSFIMIKNIDATSNWNMYDVRRSTVADRANKILYPNLSNAEPSATNYYFDMNDSGFVVSATNHEQHNFAGRTYLYMAFK